MRNASSESISLNKSITGTVSAFKVFKATVLKDLIMGFRYKENLISSVIALFVRMLIFLVLSQAVLLQNRSEITTSAQLFVFFQGAIILFAFKGTALETPLRTISQDLYNGTLEFLYSNPISRYAYYLGSVFSSVLINLPVFLPLYIFLVVTSGVSIINMLMIILVCLAVFMCLTSFGVMIGLLGLLWKQINSMTSLIDLAFEFLAGAYFPIVMYPKVIQFFAYLLPFTWGYDLIRYYSLSAWRTIFPVWIEWCILGVSVIFFFLLSRFLLANVEKMAKKKGLNLI